MSPQPSQRPSSPLPPVKTRQMGKPSLVQQFQRQGLTAPNVFQPSSPFTPKIGLGLKT